MDQSDDSRKRLILPPDVTVDHVLGLVELLNSLGNKTDSMYIGDAINENIGILPHAIDVAEVLGLVESRGGDLTLTELGRRVVKGNPKAVKNLLKKEVRKLEPIAELMSRLKESGKITVEEFDELIMKHYPGNFEMAKHNVLQWGAFLNLFKMSEDDTEIVLLYK